MGSTRDDLQAEHEYSRHGQCAAESVAPACELYENNNTLTTVRFKHGEARL